MIFSSYADYGTPAEVNRAVLLVTLVGPLLYFFYTRIYSPYRLKRQASSSHRVAQELANEKGSQSSKLESRQRDRPQRVKKIARVHVGRQWPSKETEVTSTSAQETSDEQDEQPSPQPRISTVINSYAALEEAKVVDEIGSSTQQVDLLNAISPSLHAMDVDDDGFVIATRKRQRKVKVDNTNANVSADLISPMSSTTSTRSVSPAPPISNESSYEAIRSHPSDDRDSTAEHYAREASAATAKVTMLQDQIIKMKEVMKGLSDTNTCILNQLKAEKEKLEAAQERVITAEQHSLEQKRQLSQVIADCSHARDDLAQLTSENAHLTALAEQRLQTIAVLETALEEARHAGGQLVGARQDIERLRADKEALQVQVTTLQDHLVEAIATRDEIAVTAARYLGDVNDLRKQLGLPEETSI